MNAFVVTQVVTVAALLALHFHGGRAKRVVDDGPMADPAETAALDELATDQGRLRGYY